MLLCHHSSELSLEKHHVLILRLPHKDAIYFLFERGRTENSRARKNEYLQRIKGHYNIEVINGERSRSRRYGNLNSSHKAILKLLHKSPNCMIGSQELSSFQRLCVCLRGGRSGVIFCSCSVFGHWTKLTKMAFYKQAQIKRNP